ncbi:Essential recombination function protein [uncultured Caudovirales phage]|uniref:Essential recombination function protein n=1 Tax=uncultured Caudovirales phage TaxID=2100421 RepID=A0A6J5M7U2_9CAUD|nr:Essential recombination function protein [uncultured Caudovirales phage]
MSDDLLDTDQQNADQEAYHYQVLAHEHEVKTSGNDIITTAILEAAHRGNSAVLKELIEMKNAERDRVAKLAFSKAFVEMKPNLPLVIKSHKNQHTNSSYAKLEDINAAVDPVLGKHNFATKHKIIAQTNTSVTVRVELLHSHGHSEYSDLTMPLDGVGTKGNSNKTDIQAISSTVSYLRRVALCALLNISTGDDIDGNKINHEAPKPVQKPVEITSHDKLKLYAAFTGATPEIQKAFFDKFKTKEGIEVSDVTSDTFYTFINIPDATFFNALKKLQDNQVQPINQPEE